MASRNYETIPVRLPKKLRARVMKIAKRENRLHGTPKSKYHGIGRHAEMLLRLGLAEYERQQAAAEEHTHA